MNAPEGRLSDGTSGGRFDLAEVTSIGRSADSGIPVSDPRVSRRHAMIRRHDDGFWFFDLGSINGSYINDRRVTTSQLLISGDMIQIADRKFRFEGGVAHGAGNGETFRSDLTIADVKSRSVVILVSDIRNFTSLSERLAPDQLAPIIGTWYARTEAILDGHGATLDKFIGDCVLAYWLDTSVASRIAALKAAFEMSKACDGVRHEHWRMLEPTGLTFGSGTAVHMGSVAHGAFTPKEFSLLGDTVNITFRLEALTRTLERPILVSSELLEGWSEGRLFCTSLGLHFLKGRAQPVEVHSLDRDPGARDSGKE